jgi:dihydroflavonol-4-reductase
LAVKKAMRGVDWVFHVAAIADDWRHSAKNIYRVNVGGTQNILQAVRSAGVKRLIFTSSSATLGIPTLEKPLMDETCTFNLLPDDWPYAWSKVLCERIIRRAVNDGMDAVMVLPTAILGPADTNFISGQLLLRAGKGLAFPFPHGGVNYIDVRDVAEALVQAALRGKTGERYLLGGHNLSHLHCMGTIADILGTKIRYAQMPNVVMPVLAHGVEALRRLGIQTPIDPQRVRMSGMYMYYENRKAVNELGLHPRSFDETVEDTHKWYSEHGMMPSLKIPVLSFRSAVTSV